MYSDLKDILSAIPQIERHIIGQMNLIYILQAGFLTYFRVFYNITFLYALDT